MTTVTIRTIAQRIQELTAVGLTPAEALPAAQQEYAAEMAAIAAAENARAEEAKKAAAEAAATSDTWDFHGLKIRGGKGKNGLPTSFAKAAENGLAIIPAQIGKDRDGIDQYYPPCLWVGLKDQTPKQITWTMAKGLLAVHQAKPEALAEALEAVAGAVATATYDAEKQALIDSGKIPKPGNKRR